MSKHNRTRKKRSGLGMQRITATINTTMVLILLGLVLFFVFTAHNLSVYVRENINFSILISDDMKEADILKLQKQIDATSYVKSSEYISKEQALAEQTEALGSDPSEFLGRNPFTASLEIKLNSDYANADSVAMIEKQLKKNTNIQDVLYKQELIDLVNENIRNITLVLLGLAALLTLISFALINNTIRLTIYAKRFTIHTMKLVGANWSFIRRPFLRQHVRNGMVAAFLADVALAGGICWLLDFAPDLAQIITLELMITIWVLVMLFGILISYLCAYISINRFLRMKENDLYLV